MRVSYVIVTYHSTDQVGALVESIAIQSSEGGSEIIVVDNSPDDSCKAIVESACPSAKFIQNDSNRGYTAAINQAITLAGGEFLFLLTPDVVLQEKCTENLIAAFNGSAGATAPQLLNSDGSIQKSVRNFPRFSTLIYDSIGLAKLFPANNTLGRWRNLYFPHDQLREVEQPMASALMIHRAAMEKVGDWDEQFFVFFSDVDYCKRIYDAGYSILFVPQAKAKHEVGGSTRHEGTWLIWDSHRGFARYLQKHELRGFKLILWPLAKLLLWVGAVGRVLMRKLKGQGF